MSNMPWLRHCTLITLGISGTLIFMKTMSFAWMFLSYFLAVIIGACLGFYHILNQGMPYRPNPRPKAAGEFLKILMEHEKQDLYTSKKQHSIISRNIDGTIEEVLDLIIRDYVMYYLKHITSEHKRIKELVKDDMWIVVKNAKGILAKIDEVKFVANDVTNKLCQHYQKIRLSSLGDGKEHKPIFYLRPYLQTPETEIEFLRKVSEALLVLLLPPSYSRCEPVCHLLREILACSVLHPAIEMICDPDYINQKLLAYILYQHEMLEHHKKTYAFAATFEDFIKMISESTDVIQLKQMRYKIISEIMQSTTIGNLKKAKGMNIDKEFNPQSVHKGDLLQARNLPRYINQLTIAKNRCEQKIKILGGPDYTSPSSPAEECHEELSPNIPGRTVLSFQVIMESPHARQYFMKFLVDENSQSFLGFWEAVELMKLADKATVYQDANKLYAAYITTSKVKFEKSILKGMESFLTGDKGPEAFFTAQEIVGQYLEERHYHRFIVSDWYHKMLKGADERGIDFLSASSEQSQDSEGCLNHPMTEDGGSISNILLTDHSSFARSKLLHLDEKLTNKMQALLAIRDSQSSDAKVVSKLEREIDSMKQEKRSLEIHIKRTEVWSDNFGKWAVQILETEVKYDREKPSPVFTLHIYKKESDPLYDGEKDVTSWQMTKRLSEFLELHRKLVQIGPWLSCTELPKEGKLLFKHYDKTFFEKAKHLLQSYMTLVMDDDKLNRSECLYTFLSPSPELLIQPHLSPKKNKFFFTNFFKGNPTSNRTDSNEEDEFLFWDDDPGPIRDDSIAEPLFTLISEIFDMTGLFKLVRRKLISFVQIAYGRTINRQLRETISWVFSEAMIIYYIHLFRDGMWPDGVLAKPVPLRSEEEKRNTRANAKHLFINSIPEVLNNLVVGQDNARRGALKVFESFQDVRFNKQLFYEMFEILLNEIFPDVKNASN